MWVIVLSCAGLALRHIIAFEEHTDNHTALNTLLEKNKSWEQLAANQPISDEDQNHNPSATRTPPPSPTRTPAWTWRGSWTQVRGRG